MGGGGRDPKKCTGRDWGMGSSTIEWALRPIVKYHLRRGVGLIKFLENESRPQPPPSLCNLLIIYPSIHFIGITSPRFARSSIVFSKVYVPMSPSGAKTHLLVCHDSFICMIWLLHVCRDSLIMRLAWFLYMCDITHSCAQHRSFRQRSSYQWVH